jgi:hydroxyacylglutathione hydrolase
VSYYLPDAFEQPVLLCGDTIFSGGCGRLFDGTIEQLFTTFEHLYGLSESTIIACAHEYTLSNLEFALAITPDHRPTQDYNNRVKYLRARGEPSLPTYLALEKAINPYMRCLAFEPDWIAQLSQFAHRQGVSDFVIDTPFDAFKLCRALKNHF